MEQVQADSQCLLFAAKALLAIIIRKTEAADRFGDRRGSRGGVGVEIADENRKPVAPQMARSQLVPMPKASQDVDPIGLDPSDAGLTARGD